jgi:hypothetical protein
LTRAEATAKALEIGVPVWIALVAGASQVRITTPVASAADNFDHSPADSVTEPTFT